MKINKFILLWALLIFVFLIRVIYFIAQPDFCTDHVSQMALAKSFMEGNGVSLPYVADGDISKINYKIQILWPPLYMILLGLITYITNNMLISSFIIKVVCLALISLYLFKLVLEYDDILETNTKFILASFVIISTSIFNNLNTILIPPLTILLIAIYYFLKFIDSPSKSNIKLLFISLFTSLILWFHYTYILIIYFIPVYLSLTFFKSRAKDDFIKIIISIIAVTTSLILLLSYNLKSAGLLSYIEDSYYLENGIFFKNLINFNPLFLYAFFKIEYIYNFIPPVILLKIFFNFISFLLFLLVVIQLKKLIDYTTDFTKVKIITFVKIFYIVIILAIIIPFIFSLRYNYISNPDWTYIGESRYFSNAHLLIIIILFIIGFNKLLKNTILTKLIKVLLIFSLIINIMLNIINIKINFKNDIFNVDNLVRLEPVKDLYFNIKAEKQKGNKVIYIDNGATVRQLRIAALAGAVICDSAYFMNNEVKTFDDVVCIFSVVSKDMRDIDRKLNEFGRINNYEKIGELYNEPLYKVYLKP